MIGYRLGPSKKTYGSCDIPILGENGQQSWLDVDLVEIYLHIRGRNCHPVHFEIMGELGQMNGDPGSQPILLVDSLWSLNPIHK